MEKTWRWFGRQDAVTLNMLRQIGVEGIVTALHHIPNGDVWQSAEISALRDYIERHGLRWSVVESLPVSETIKYGGGGRNEKIENYKTSLANLGKAGIKTVCYNFMPVIDWIRTDLNFPLENGTQTLLFDYGMFAYFDCCILNRDGAAACYDSETMSRVEEISRNITEREKLGLIDTIIVKTQGFINGNISDETKDPVSVFKDLLSRYNDTGKKELRDNLEYFLSEVIPVAERYGIKMCIHPDDPPFPVLGLPRIVSDDSDIGWLLSCVESESNGLAFCAGSLSAGAHNDVPALARKYASRSNFVHLRYTRLLGDKDFMETSHLDGDGKLPEVISIFHEEGKRRCGSDPAAGHIPFRVDHGPLILSDLDDNRHNPGYSFYGRMKALGEVSGMIHAVEQLNNHLPRR